MLEEYCQAIDVLTINEENRLKLKVQEIASKTETKYRLQENEDKLTIMAERFNKIQSQMNTLLSPRLQNSLKNICQLVQDMTRVPQMIEQQAEWWIGGS